VDTKPLLLVEGKDDLFVICGLLKYHQLPKTFEVKDSEGVDPLLDRFEAEIVIASSEQLGIVIDADTDLSARWQCITSILKKAGYSALPDSPSQEGTIIRCDNKPTVGIWIMPNNSLPGMLENFIEFLVPCEDRLLQLAKDAVDNIPKEDRRFRPTHHIKAQIHTWLAWQEMPGKPLGQAITARYLDAEATHAQLLVNWMRSLFVL
jgi:hypothetical protein